MKWFWSIVLLVLVGGGIWLLGTSKEDKGWSPDRVRENVAGTVRSEKKPEVSNVQTVHISLGEKTASEAERNEEDKTSPKSAAASQSDNLKKTVDSASSDPTRSWSTEEKTARPVEYMNSVLAYLDRKRAELRNMRFDVGTTLQEWEQKLEKSEKTMKGREAVLRDAARTYQQAAKNNSWPVDFAYRDYNEAEMTLKLSDCHREFLRSQAEVRRIRQGVARLRDTSMKHDREMARLDREIKIYSENLELGRSGKVTGEMVKFMEALDKSVADQAQLAKESQIEAEEVVFMPAGAEKAEAAASRDDILKKYGTPEK